MDIGTTSVRFYQNQIKGRRKAMEIRKNSGPLKWILIGISALFLIVMLILPLTYVLVTAFG